MKSILMIHDMKEKYLSYPLDKYILTFDDCLYSVYKYRQQLSKIDTEKYLAVPTGRILESRTNLVEDIDCVSANNMWLYNNDNSAYMIVEEILEMKKLGFILTGHGHQHARGIKHSSKLRTNNIQYIQEDTSKMLHWFDTYIQERPIAYTFPYNEYTLYLKCWLYKEGFRIFFDNDRIPIEMV